MDAVAFLINEHNKVRKSFTDILEGSHRDETTAKMFNLLCDDLIRHETMEQEIWYPHLKRNEKLSEIITHLIAEEKSAKKTIKEFRKIKDAKEWNKKFMKFKREVEHHAREEETKLFPKVKKILTENELLSLGKMMREYKRDYLQLMAA
ncbi:MAG: hemerythrin domain-containing protein [Gammaproteobacteria bacterium]|nr:hemerythrin domain-containing protein [Gammaproteobacteria bacterium]